MDMMWDQFKSLDEAGVNAICAGLLVVITVLVMKLSSMLHPYGSFSTSILRPYVSSILTSKWLWRLTNWSTGVVRKLTGQLTLNCFIACDCPHSYALLQALRHLIRSRSLPVRVRVFVIPMESISSSTSVGNHMKWYLFDSRMFCTLYSDFGLVPPANRSVLRFFSEAVTEEAAEAQLKRAVAEEWHRCMEAVTARMLKLQLEGGYQSAAAGDTSPLDSAIDLLGLIWDEKQYAASKGVLLAEHQASSSAAVTSADVTLVSNKKLMERLGYYGSGLVEFKGSWYSCSRLHHLEREEFGAAGAACGARTPLYCRELDSYFDNSTSQQRLENYGKFKIPPELLAVGEEMSAEAIARGECIELFYSFRSPYSQLVLDRTLFLCAKYKKKLALRPMLPMIARNLAVPLSKVMYIAGDANREAQFWNFTFGCISDPSHSGLKPVHRALTVYLLAARSGLHAAFVKAFGLFVWGRGVDAGTDIGMRLITDCVGLDWSEVSAALRPEALAAAEEQWRAVTTANLAALGGHGHWGVPALKFREECLVWGQDKLWVMDRYLAHVQRQARGPTAAGADAGAGAGGKCAPAAKGRASVDAALVKIIEESGH